METRRGEVNPPSATAAVGIVPEAVSSRTGVSVRYVQTAGMCWYVFRASYGREDKAFDYIVEQGTFAYIAKRYEDKPAGSVVKKALVNLIPNLLFVYTTANKAQEFIKGTPALSYLTYYYNHFEVNNEHKNPPLTIPCSEMENFILATCNHSEHLRLVKSEHCHYKGGETVRVKSGQFKGVTGKVARVYGQQRVVVSLSDAVGLISTAYIPTAFIEVID